jgi:hypothetical protein
MRAVHLGETSSPDRQRKRLTTQKTPGLSAV